MIVSFAHDDRVEEYSTQDMATIESAEVERVTGLEWDDVETALKAQKPLAMSAIIWVFRRRQEAGLKFDGFSLPQWKRRLKARLEREELLDLLEGVRENLGEDQVQEAARSCRVLAHRPDDVDSVLAELAAPKAQKGTGKTSK
ncbi:hypothetical protein [Streptomyces sp. NPDC045251]|uniref:hypothetical protein n=1 Tax=unclassified Streptomyces TaxID=2593676 RepID=UPI0033E7033A